jgi:hypothetical protein
LLGGGDETISVLVENLEGLKDFFISITLPHLTGHHCQLLWEVDGSTTNGIDMGIGKREKL